MPVEESTPVNSLIIYPDEQSHSYLDQEDVAKAIQILQATLHESQLALARMQEPGYDWKILSVGEKCRVIAESSVLPISLISCVILATSLCRT